MLRLLVCLAALLSGLFIVVVGVISSARAYSNPALYDFLRPAGCAAPCFMGIRPGVTSADELFAILRRHEWVSTLYDFTQIADGVGIPGVTGDVRWDWSGAQPAWIDDRVQGLLRLNLDRVRFVAVATHIRLGDARLLLAAPDWETITTELHPDFGMTATYNAAHRQAGLLLRVPRIVCPAASLWNRPVTLNLWDHLATTPGAITPLQVHVACRQAAG
jgi:hypothetical protein